MHKLLRCVAPLVLLAVGNARADLPALETLARISLPANCTAGGITIQGEYAYLATSCGLMVVDTGTRAVVATSDVGFLTDSLLAVGRYVYVQWGGDLMVFDIHDANNPTSPEYVTRLSVGAGLFAASGKYFFLQDSNYNSEMNTYGGIRVMDATNPLAPVLVARLPLNGTPHHTALSGAKLYVAQFESQRLEVIDVSQPTAPRDIAYLPLSERPYGLAVAGKYAYVTTHGWDCDTDCMSWWKTAGDIHMIDIRYPACPREVATIHCSGAPELAWTDGNTLYEIEEYGSYMFALDLANPAAPVDLALNILGPRDWYDVSAIVPAVGNGAVFVPLGTELLVLKAPQQTDYPPGGVCLP